MRPSLILVILMLSFCGCSPIRDENDVYGSYELTSTEAKVRLKIEDNHTFSQTIEFSNGEQQRNSGTWRWEINRVLYWSDAPALRFQRSLRRWEPTT